MASWIEIDHVRKDPAAFKPLAKRLPKDPSFERSEFADDFLENIINWKRHELTTRQGEILLQLRDEAEIHYEFKGLSIPILIDKCFANRFDLDAGDRQRIQRLRESGKRYATGGQWDGSTVCARSSMRWKAICEAGKFCSRRRTHRPL